MFDLLDVQIDSALRVGELDATALREIVIFLAHYAGWPKAARLNGQVEALLARTTQQD
jgi:4-carboxymuconolactone decarboxylase